MPGLARTFSQGSIRTPAVICEINKQESRQTRSFDERRRCLLVRQMNAEHSETESCFAANPSIWEEDHRAECTGAQVRSNSVHSFLKTGVRQLVLYSPLFVICDLDHIRV
jgi:hypothetical protein